MSSMLVMLDSINSKFSKVEGLWEKLKSGAISFYFLPVKEMGLTDDLYIKMNSRGKPLTLFEHFKAELEGEIRKQSSIASSRIAGKIDGEWTDLLWKYRAEDSTTDNEFLSTKHKDLGLGTQSVKSIAEQYGGICRFEIKDGMFCASVMCNKR